MNILDLSVNLRCRLEGIWKHVYINSKTTFNRAKLKTGLGDIIGSSEYPVKLISSHLAGNIDIKYGGVLLNCDLKTSHSGKIQLDRFVSANNLSIEAADATVKIGSFCSIAKTAILLTGHDYNRITTYYIKRHVLRENDPLEVKYKGKEVVIGHDVWVGYDTIILGGVHIGNGAIIGAGSVITKDVEPYAIYAGNPARFIKWRFSEETISTIQKTCWWHYDLDQLKQLAMKSDTPINQFLASHFIVEGVLGGQI